MLELNLRFPENNQVIIRLDDQEIDKLDFTSPLTAEDQEDIRWYLEEYATGYMTEVDDKTAKRTEEKLPQWGESLFNAVFKVRDAQRIFNDFQNAEEPGRLLTISASHPTILSLPWELLRDPASDIYLFNENPRISIRRRFAGAGGGRRPFKFQQKDRLQLLFVISRPSDAGFIDPRGEAKAVLDAIAETAAGRVEVEFLRPATLDNLVARLENQNLPPVDIVHFDGHGVYDSNGQLHEQAKLSDPTAVTKSENSNGGNTGYLLFEDKTGKRALITAETLGEMLHRQKVGLIVLSACQSGKVAGEDAMGCVAARLTHAGIPAVLAMTHSVLVLTAHQLFAKFYQRLVQGECIGEALDNGRRDLYLNKERGERQRGNKRITLKLQDWFIPALYQAAGDGALLTRNLTPLAPLPYEEMGESYSPLRLGEGQGERSIWGNLPELQEAGFFGRSRELWDIERWFIQGTRRITISGFGGQGKTYLVAEAGRWLHCTGMFEKVCFVDYAAFQGVDAMGLAVSTLATVLGENLIDANAVTTYLRDLSPSPSPARGGEQDFPIPSSGRGGEQNSPIPLQGRGARGVRSLFIILDNLESLQPEPLQELLTVAKQWSEVRECRLLLTTRTPDLNHPDYRNEGSLKHRSLPLQGLGREDALAYVQSLWKLPPIPVYQLPERDDLWPLFRLVAFHPLSLGLLARQLKVRPSAELRERLAALIVETPDNPLLASLNLSLERLDDEAREWLPKLGVFQGGAFENYLVGITEFSESQWQKLRPALENTGLIQPELLPGVKETYIQFHPTLAPALWSRLSDTQQKEILNRHRECYCFLSAYLHDEDVAHPVKARSIAKRELPNLLFAVHISLDMVEESTVYFVSTLNRFLEIFGLIRERANLTQRTELLTSKLGSLTWYFTQLNTGQQLYITGQYKKAERVFAEVLAGLDEQPSFERCRILNWLGRSLYFQEKTTQAAQFHREALAIAEQLKATKEVKQLMGVLNSDLADVLLKMGAYREAKIAYETALSIHKKNGGDAKNEAVVECQLGTLALEQDDLLEAEQRYLLAQNIFRQLNETEAEAGVWHQLGRVYEEANQLNAAELAYREAARYRESQGHIAGAASIWNNLGSVTESSGKLVEAEAWYRKAIKTFEISGNMALAHIPVNNLAGLLENQPQRLPEARQFAEEALAIKQTLDPAAAEIWKTYVILANIADKQGDTTQSREYRRLSRQTKAAFAGTRYELRQYGQLMAAVVVAVDDVEVRQQLEPALEEATRSDLAAAIRRVLDGERDEDVLCESLDLEESMIINAILRGIADPGTLSDLLEGEEG